MDAGSESFDYTYKIMCFIIIVCLLNLLDLSFACLCRLATQELSLMEATLHR